MATVPTAMTPPEVAVIPVPTTEEIVIGPYRVPVGITDLASFRAWTYEEDFPKKGNIFYINGLIWVDLSMEQLYTHNVVKTEITVVVGGLVRADHLGLFMTDGMRFSNLPGDISTEPDAMFTFYETL